MSEYIYQLIVQRGPRPGETFTLNADVMIIGRDPMSDIVINDPEISRNHARLTLVEGGYKVQDMGSTNGTYVNGKRLRGEPFVLQQDEQVILGSNVTLIFRIETSSNPLMETVLSDTGGMMDFGDFGEFQQPAAGQGTFLSEESFDEAVSEMSAAEFEEEVYSPAPAPPSPTIDERPQFDIYDERPSPARKPRAPESPKSQRASGADQNEDEGESRRNYIMIGAGVGLLLCCCFFGLVLLAAYFLQSQGLLEGLFVTQAHIPIEFLQTANLLL